jgi:peptidoglycan/xylan/chitin deacetylase (PgdA/CDA1 family)
VRGKRALLAQVLETSGVTELLLRAGSRTRFPWLTVLTYHRVIERPRDYPFDDGVVDATPDMFEEQLATISRYFRFIGANELCDYVRGAPLPPNPIAITFDDGYRDNHDVVLPILKRYNARATFFITTDYLTRRRMFWWDKLAYLVKRAEVPALELSYPERVRLPLDPLGEDRARALKHILSTPKQVRDLDLDRYIDDVARAAGVTLGIDEEKRLADEMLMTWDQVRSLRAAGMDIGSHTRSHRVLQTLPVHRLADELEGSRHDLQRELGEQPNVIAYPVGRSIAQEPEIVASLRAAGYLVGLSNASGTNRLSGRPDPFDLKRIAVDGDLPHWMFRAMMAIPLLLG